MTAAVLSAVCMGSVVATLSCEEKKPLPAAAVEPSAETPKPTRSDDDDDEEPKVVAHPPGYVPPEAGPPVGVEPRTGLCSFNESGFDGMDTRSTEKLIIKVKEDTLVHAQYSYRGSYALDGEGTLDLPLRDKKWTKFELKMTSGTKTFEVRVRSDIMDLRGTAAKDAQGSCAWEDLDRKDKRRMKRK